jgi:beta-phosphoglucomutase-like phosphatase (HAD superfamily)
VGAALAEEFAVFAGDIVPRKKPAPDIYLHALAALGVDPREAVVVEDSAIGLAAARAAGLPTVITVSAYTSEEEFPDAALVLSSLGDAAAGETARVLADPDGLSPAGDVRLADIDAVLSTARLAHHQEES